MPFINEDDCFQGNVASGEFPVFYASSEMDPEIPWLERSPNFPTEASCMLIVHLWKVVLLPLLNKASNWAQRGEVPRPRTQQEVVGASLPAGSPGGHRSSTVSGAGRSSFLVAGQCVYQPLEFTIGNLPALRLRPLPFSSICYSSDQDAFGLHLRDSHLPLSWMQS